MRTGEERPSFTQSMENPIPAAQKQETMARAPSKREEGLGGNPKAGRSTGPSTRNGGMFRTRAGSDTGIGAGL